MTTILKYNRERGVDGGGRVGVNNPDDCNLNFNTKTDLYFKASVRITHSDFFGCRRRRSGHVVIFMELEHS